MNNQLNKNDRKELKKQEKINAKKARELKKIARKIGSWGISILIVVVIIFSLIKLSSSGNTQLGKAWTKGSATAKIVITEYSDLQCGACAAYYPVIKKVMENFADDVLFEYRHFPLAQIHSNAHPAARATEAAGEQGKFWQMHDMIFDGQKNWENQSVRRAKNTFAEYAETLELDMEKFNTDVDSKKIKQKVRADYNHGAKLGVNATPTFFVNGEKTKIPASYAAFENLIKEKLFLLESKK